MKHVPFSIRIHWPYRVVVAVAVVAVVVAVAVVAGGAAAGVALFCLSCKRY